MGRAAGALLVEKDPTLSLPVSESPVYQAAFLVEPDQPGDPYSPDFLTEFTEGLTANQQTVLFYLLNRPDERIERSALLPLVEAGSHNSRQNKFTRFLYTFAQSPFGESIYTTLVPDGSRHRQYWFHQDGELQPGDRSIFEVNGVIKPYGPRIKPPVAAAGFETVEAFTEFLESDRKSPVGISTLAELRFVQAYLQSLHASSFQPASRGEVQAYTTTLDEQMQTVFERCNQAIRKYHKDEANKHAQDLSPSRVVLRGAGVVENDDEAEHSWKESGNCLGVDTDLFYPTRGASTREAKEVCRGCAVREQCLEEALAGQEKFGIWGGMSERERRRARRQRAIARKAGANALA